MARGHDTALDHAVRLVAGATIPDRHRKPLLRRTLARIVGWIDRARRRRTLGELDELNDHLLRDIGVTRDEARREAIGPFRRSDCGGGFD